MTQHRVHHDKHWRTRVLAWGITVAACVLLAEVGGWLGLCVLEGGWVSYGKINAEMQQSSTEIIDMAQLPTSVLDPAWEEIVHPYFGASYPVYERQNVRTHGDESLADYGFKEDSGPLVRERRDDQFVINIVGGSVARGFLDWGGREVLKKELEKLPAFKGKNIVFSTSAFYGHKEPQQLLAVNYLMTLGAKFDLIVSMDGFNEITMGKVYNEGPGASPFYPFGWFGRLWKTNPDPQQTLLRGEIAYMREKRQKLAAGFVALPVHRSMFTSFLWKVFDHRSQAAIEEKVHVLSISPPPDVKDVIDPGPVPHYLDDNAYLKDQVSVWKEGTRQLARLSKANGITFVSVLQPNQYAGKHVMTKDERAAAWNNDTPFKTLTEQGYPLLRVAGKELAREEQITFEDFSDVFDSVKQSVYTDDCCHFNAPLGNEIVAKRLARVIAKQYD